MTIRDGCRETSPEPRSTPLSVLYQELAEFLEQLRDGSRRAAERAEALLAQRLADGGVQ